ncbi:hypothetical protein E0Z10_g5943 [Xylaria hypoxylon]|uniref:Uncharacterized protein n=1 Tax=Xylaria hypoxylon TaxID=37992 RepID=A0A4Z0YTU0_9PEZI|nr:hypothetical protein E0Z10_g5943 [Xylaria hypoxylon]
MWKWLYNNIGPGDDSASDTDSSTPTTYDRRPSNKRVAVDEEIEDHRRGNIFGDNGFERVYSTTFSQGATVWTYWVPELPLPAVLAASRDILFRSAFRYPFYPLYSDFAEESEDGTRQPSLVRGLVEEYPNILSQPVVLPRCELDSECRRRSSVKGDNWPRNRVEPPPLSPPSSPLPLLTGGNRHLRDYFEDSSAPSSTHPDHCRCRRRQPLFAPAQPSTSTANKHRTTTTATSTNRPSSTDMSALSSYSHGLAMARSAGHTGIIEPLRRYDPRPHPAQRDSKPPLPVHISLTTPERALERYPQQGRREVVQRAQQLRPRDR